MMVLGMETFWIKRLHLYCISFLVSSLLQVSLSSFKTYKIELYGFCMDIVLPSAERYWLFFGGGNMVALAELFTTCSYLF